MLQKLSISLCDLLELFLRDLLEQSFWFLWVTRYYRYTTLQRTTGSSTKLSIKKRWKIELDSYL